MTSILVINIKGGCGKTTIATNLAGAFASGGLSTALADADRQKSALLWLKKRPDTAAPIRGLNWSKEIGPVPKDIARIVIDAPAALTMGQVRNLLSVADILVVPVLPSLFDIGATKKLLSKLDEVGSIRKGKKPIAVVRNRVRTRSRASVRLDEFMQSVGGRDCGQISDRAKYQDLIEHGMSLFDGNRWRMSSLIKDWRPLLTFIEDAV